MSKSSRNIPSDDCLRLPKANVHQDIKTGEMIAFFVISSARQHVSSSKCSLLFGPQAFDGNHDAINSVPQVESEVCEENYLGLSFPDGG